MLFILIKLQAPFCCIIDKKKTYLKDKHCIYIFDNKHYTNRVRQALCNA